jgi:hypothetical protein
MLRVRAGSPPGPDVAPGAVTRDLHTALAIGRRNGIETWRFDAPPFNEFSVIDDLSAVIAASDPSERRTKLFGLDCGR